jgi:hypothetical protein
MHTNDNRYKWMKKVYHCARHTSLGSGRAGVGADPFPRCSCVYTLRSSFCCAWIDKSQLLACGAAVGGEPSIDGHVARSLTVWPEARFF